MKILLTGAAGFLGWHTRLRLQALTNHEVVPVTRADWPFLGDLIQGADAVLHLAGVNRAADDDEVLAANVELAEALAAVVPDRCKRIVYANSIRANSLSPYGRGKANAGDVLARAAERNNAAYVDVRLPNLFGEHARPHYNSFVATFVEAATQGAAPALVDNELPLLHAQDAAKVLINALDTNKSRLDPHAPMRSVREVWDLLTNFADSYRHGQFPDLGSQFRVDLFNTYRSALFPRAYPLELVPHTDSRGTFLETVRSGGGEGQSSISTTAPGVTRGQHFHLRKVERFVVIEGEATIQLRRMFHDEVVTFEVSGCWPSAIDMPTGWIHNIRNTGRSTLLTQFWTNELFNPEEPDTFPEQVLPSDPLEIKE